MNATTPLPEGYVVHLPTAHVARPPHQFGAHKSVGPNALLNRHAQTERTCAACGVTKITVHPPEGGGWREWRFANSDVQYADDRVPECVAVKVGTVP